MDAKRTTQNSTHKIVMLGTDEEMAKQHIDYMWQASVVQQ